MAARRCWIVVASAEHARRGRREGFMQACHGKAAPLRRLRPGDRVACYSPTVHFGQGDRLQAFTALGTVQPGQPYRADLERGFQPFRRDVAWHETGAAALADLQPRLAFTHAPNWGYRLRQGLVEISEADMATIAEAMFRAAARSGRPAR